jgi:outer membrane protein OmpA-like peptidoglycan-associated protein
LRENNLNMLIRSFLFLLLWGAAFTAVAQTRSVFDSLYTTKTFMTFFDSGKSDLDTAARLTLDSVLLQYGRYKKNGIVRITAHTDADGSAEINEALALRRAESVEKWLLLHQVPAKAIVSINTFGERQPLSSNDSEAGRRMNRRATIEVDRLVPMTTFEGRITDQKTGEGISAMLTFSTKTRTDTTQTDTSGYYRVRLPKDSIVRMDVVAKNYFFESVMSKMFGTPALMEKSGKSGNIQLAPAGQGDKIALKNLHFRANSPVLLPVSFGELPKLIKFMEINPDYIIEIGGHINLPYAVYHGFSLSPGQSPAQYVMTLTTPGEKTLSLRRAQTIQSYLLNHQIDASRLVVKGYDNSQMLFPHASSEAEQEANRRVEIKVIGKVGQ